MIDREKCRSLRAIQKKIAEENGVDMIYPECSCSRMCAENKSDCEGIHFQHEEKAGLGKIVQAGLSRLRQGMFEN